MKKYALLLASLWVLLALPAQAEMIVNDHFDGSSLDTGWNISKSHAYHVNYNYGVYNSNLSVNYMQTTTATTPYIKFYQQFEPVDDFEVEFRLSWGDVWLSSPRVGLFGLRLFDSDNDLVSAIYYNDVEETGQDHLRVSNGESSENHYVDLSHYGSGTGSMVGQDGILSFYWDDVLLTSMELLDQVTRLELFFQDPSIKYGWQNITKFNVDQVTLESDPEGPSATPEPGTMMLLGSALGLGAWWQRRRKRSKQV